MIEAKNREQRLKMKTQKIHDDSDFIDISTKPDERENTKEPDGLRTTLITQCEQEYENLINTVRESSGTSIQLILRKQIYV